MFPTPCGSTGFKRPADLERHYKNVHATDEQRNRILCDYLKCGRSTEPFTRKDHARDHYRDYHKEDIGAAKAQKNLDSKQFLKIQETWKNERKISANWWRCARCLTKVYVDPNGWGCPGCKSPCETERITSRQRLSENAEQDTEFSLTSSDAQVTSYDTSACSYCGGTGWVANYFGGGACSSCQTSQSSVSYT